MDKELMTLTPTEARDLERNGYTLEHVMMHLDGTDTYQVFVK